MSMMIGVLGIIGRVQGKVSLAKGVVIDSLARKGPGPLSPPVDIHHHYTNPNYIQATLSPLTRNHT